MNFLFLVNFQFCPAAPCCVCTADRLPHFCPPAPCPVCTAGRLPHFCPPAPCPVYTARRFPQLWPILFASHLRVTLRVISEKLNPSGLGASRLAHCSALRAQIGSALGTYVHSWISQSLATSIQRSSFVHFEYCFVRWKDLLRKDETPAKIIA